MAGAAPLEAGGAKEAEEEKKKKEKKRGRSSDSRRVIPDTHFLSGTGAFFLLQVVLRIRIRRCGSVSVFQSGSGSGPEFRIRMH